MSHDENFILADGIIAVVLVAVVGGRAISTQEVT